MLTGLPHYPAWRVDPGYDGVWRTTEWRGGVRVHRRRHTVPPGRPRARRALYEAVDTRARHCSLRPGCRPPHAVVAQLPSLAGGVLGARLARRHRVPFVPVVQDLMGAAAAQSGIRGGDRAARLRRPWSRRVLRGATLVGVIHESFVAKVAAMGVPRGPDPARAQLVARRRARSAPGRGRARRLGWRRRTDRRAALRQHGAQAGPGGAGRDGPPRPRAARRADGRRQPARAPARGSPPACRTSSSCRPPATDDFPEVLAAADVLAVTQRASVLDMSVPSKLTSYFAAGRPVLASVADGGGTAQEVRRSGAGELGAARRTRPRSPPPSARLGRDPERAARLAAAGPAYVEADLSRKAGLARLDALLAEALGRHAAQRLRRVAVDRGRAIAVAPTARGPHTSDGEPRRAPPHDARRTRSAARPVPPTAALPLLVIARAARSACSAARWLGIAGSDSYTATTEVTCVRRPSTLRRRAARRRASISIGSERQTAAEQRRRASGRRDACTGSGERPMKLPEGLQVTNPPDTLVLRFTYTAGSAAGRSPARQRLRRRPTWRNRAQKQTTDRPHDHGYKSSSSRC